MEVYIDNPSLNDEVLHMEARVSVPSGMHVYSGQYAWAVAAGVAKSPLIEVHPGRVRTISLSIKADENARIGSHILHFSGPYYPGNNKDLYSPVSLTYSLTVKEPSIPSPTPEPFIHKVPGFEAIFAILTIAAVSYLLRRRR